MISKADDSVAITLTYSAISTKIGTDYKYINTAI